MRRFLPLPLLATAVLAAVPLPARSADDAALESGLAQALRLDRRTQERVGDSGRAIRAYMKEGVLSRRPNQRLDYTDYYLVKKPATFMGHALVMVEEEYMAAYVGCCVSPGMGITLKVSGPTVALEKFAEDNGCSFDGQADPRGVLKSMGVRASHLPRGRYVALSCRERDRAH